MKAPIDNPRDKSKWDEVIPHREDVLLQRIDLFRYKNFFILKFI